MKFINHNLRRFMKKEINQEDVVVLLRDDGKELTVNKSVVAEHLNRGNFTVKNKSDQPSDVELAAAVGYKGNFIGEDDDLPREPQRSETYAKRVVAPKPEGEAKELAKEQINSESVDTETLKGVGVSKKPK